MCTKNDVSRSRYSKVRAGTIETDRQTDRRNCTYYYAKFIHGQNPQYLQTANFRVCMYLVRLSYITIILCIITLLTQAKSVLQGRGLQQKSDHIISM